VSLKDLVKARVSKLLADAVREVDYDKLPPPTGTRLKVLRLYLAAGTPMNTPRATTAPALMVFKSMDEGARRVLGAIAPRTDPIAAATALMLTVTRAHGEGGPVFILPSPPTLALLNVLLECLDKTPDLIRQSPDRRLLFAQDHLVLGVTCGVCEARRCGIKH